MTKLSTALPTANTKVKYQYIPRKMRGNLSPTHLLYDGKLDSSIDTFSVLREPSGKYVLNLTQEEKEFIINGLRLSKDDLNLADRNNEYLAKISIEMPKSGIQLDLSEPWDMLVDGILRAYTNVVAPNKKSSKKKVSYRYARIKAGEETDTLLENADLRKKAYKLLGALEESREKMVMYLLNEGVRLHREISSKDIRKLVNERVEKGYQHFIDVLEDPLFMEKGIINMAVLLGVVKEKNKLHYYDEQPMASEGEPATLTNACIFLKDKTNSQLRIALTKETVDGFNGTK